MNRFRVIVRGENSTLFAECDDHTAYTEAQKIVNCTFRFSVTKQTNTIVNQPQSSAGFSDYFRGEFSEIGTDWIRYNLHQIGNVSLGHRRRFVFIDTQNVRNREYVQRILQRWRRSVQYGYAFEAFQCGYCSPDRRFQLADHDFRTVD